jgi:hypothetical protein
MGAGKWIAVLLIFILLTAGGVFAWYYFTPEETESVDFETDTLFLKVAIRKGGEVTSNIKITNTGKNPRPFMVGIKEMENLASIKEDKFTLIPNEEKTIEINFSGRDTFPGVRLGELEIFSDKESRVIPIILEIQSESVLFDSNINLFPTGAEVVPGQKLSAEIKIFDLASVGISNVDVDYSIRDFSGTTIFSETEEDMVVDDKYTFTKTLPLPPTLPNGNYAFITIVTYDGSVGTASIFFNVGGEVQSTGGGGELFSEKNTFYIAFGFLFVIFFVLLLYALFSRDKVLRELQNQYRSELKRQSRLTREQEVTHYAKLKTPVEKKEYKKEIKKIKKQRLGAIKEIQQERLKKFKKIGGKEKVLKKQLEKWRKEGYNTSVLEKKYKLPTKESIKKKTRSKLKKWKAQGYDTSVLEKK